MNLLFIRICIYSIDKLMTRGLENGEQCTFIRIRGPSEARPPGIRQTILPQGGRDLTVFLNSPGGCPGGDGNAWN